MNRRPFRIRIDRLMDNRTILVMDSNAVSEETYKELIYEALAADPRSEESCTVLEYRVSIERIKEI